MDEPAPGRVRAPAGRRGAMRPVLHGDLVAAARALLPVAPPARPARLAALLEAAEMAEAHRRRTGRAHPRLGTGSLMAAAMRAPLPPEPGLDDSDYLACLALVAAALRDRAAQPEAAQETQRGSVGSSSSRLGGISSPHSSQ